VVCWGWLVIAFIAGGIFGLLAAGLLRAATEAEELSLLEYDKDNDVLYVTFGPPRPSYCAKEIDGIFVMKDVKTSEYSGLKILDFSERLNDSSLLGLNLPRRPEGTNGEG